MIRYQRYYGTPWLYTDEAQTDKRGYLTNYVYKPAFSKQLLRSLMYINRLQIFSREFFDRAGGYRLGFEGSQDHDLALRMSEISTPLNVPTVAYLRRISPIDPSINENTIKNNVAEKSCRAIDEHFKRTGHLAQIDLVRGDVCAFNSRISNEW